MLLQYLSFLSTQYPSQLQFHHNQSLKYQQYFLNITILTNTCARIPTLIFFALTIILTFRLSYFIIPSLFLITCCNIELAYTTTWNMFCHCFSYMFVCYHIINALTFFSFASFGTHTLGDRTLQLPAHVLKLIMNG